MLSIYTTLIFRVLFYFKWKRKFYLCGTSYQNMPGIKQWKWIHSKYMSFITFHWSLLIYSQQIPPTQVFWVFYSIIYRYAWAVTFRLLKGCWGCLHAVGPSASFKQKAWTVTRLCLPDLLLGYRCPTGYTFAFPQSSLRSHSKKRVFQLRNHTPLGFSKLPDCKILKANCSTFFAAEEFFVIPVLAGSLGRANILWMSRFLQCAYSIVRVMNHDRRKW